MPGPFHYLLLLAVLATAATAAPEKLVENANSTVEAIGNWDFPPTGCFLRPWVCRSRPFILEPVLCCMNTCVNVSADVNNCGFCGIRCPPTFSCCNRICSNLMVDIFNCGSCSNRCPFGQLCVLGACTQVAASLETGARAATDHSEKH